VLRFLYSFLALVFIATSASAHRDNESYVYFNVSDDALSGRVEVTLDDLALLVDIDTNGDATISKTELEAALPQVFDFFAGRLSITSEGQDYSLQSSGVTYLDTPQGVFAQLQFDIPGLSPTPDSVALTYDFPYDEAEPGHLGYALIESNTRTGVEDNESRIALVFRPGDTPQELNLTADPAFKVFVDFVIHGIWHIWLGFDHVVFLIALLMATVMTVQGGRWVPVENFRVAFMNTVKLVTLFTVSHSVTLSLAALNIITLPVTLVEIIIAGSIAVVALIHLFPQFHRYTLWIVFGFGLFHGFGFANVLEPLGVQPTAKLVGLAGFNIGVEIGQLAIVIVVFPILFLLRKWSAYPFLALKAASVFFIFLAGLWLFERSSGVLWRLQQDLFAAVM